MIDIARELEKIIAIYFNDGYYIYDGQRLSREDSRILAYELINALQLCERIIARKKREINYG